MEPGLNKTPTFVNSSCSETPIDILIVETLDTSLRFKFIVWQKLHSRGWSEEMI